MIQQRPSIVDAHLDLAYNAVNGRDVAAPAAAQPDTGYGIASVGLPDLRAGGVVLICATIFCQPQTKEYPGYRTSDEAHQQMLAQLAWYQRQQDQRHMTLVTGREQLKEIGEPHRQRAILLLEGADPIRTVRDVPELFARGVRIVGLAWGRTRYAGGTGQPGPLTAEGIELVSALDRVGMIHDASHLAEESFWQLLDRTGGPVIASHSNCRAIVPTDRQLSDQMIRALARRGGVIGINFFDRFLLPPDERAQRRATLQDVVAHVRHICDLVGDARHVGIGTDMDGGLGREQIPVEIRTSADLPRTGDALSAAGFNDTDVAAILGSNWMEFFENHLAGQSA